MISHLISIAMSIIQSSKAGATKNKISKPNKQLHSYQHPILSLEIAS